MDFDTTSIAALVKHQGGPVNVARRLGIPYQRVQEWIGRGWASPKYLFRLKPLLPRGVTVADLDADRERAKAAA